MSTRSVFRCLLHVAVLPLCCLFEACGTRTGLPGADAGDPCEEAGITRPCTSVCGVGVETCIDGAFRGCTAKKPREPGTTSTLRGTIRDFHDTHPDFEKNVDDDRGIVARTLGPDRKPVYAGGSGTRTTHGKTAFDQWYRDVTDVNVGTPYELVLHKTDRKYVYAFEDLSFFPIDDTLFGNEGRTHDYHFTLELHGDFLYLGGESFTFAGDDDLFAFMANQLVIDLGGVHSSRSQTVSLDALAPSLGLRAGELYPIDLFYAERHTSESSLHVETTIGTFDPCR